MIRRTAAVVALALVAPLFVACGGGGPKSTALKHLELPSLNGKLLDLTVRPETANIKSLKGAKRPYIDSIGVFSLRQGDLLEATLQVSKFSKSAPTNQARFRSSVISQVGSTNANEFRMGSSRVFITTGKRQSIDMWFRDRYFFVLSIRDEYKQSRALLRNALVIEP
jgi:hypothetical protein